MNVNTTFGSGVELRFHPDGRIFIDGTMPPLPPVPPSQKQPRASTSSTIQEPFPQALDDPPDMLVASLPQVPDDSKPKLAETFGVVTLPPPMLGQRF